MTTRRSTGAACIALTLITMAILGASPDRAAAGACARRGLGVDLVAGEGSTFSRGLVVALSQGGSLGSAPDGSDGGASRFEIGAALERGDDRIELRVRSLAPGLALLVPASRARVGPWTLHTRGARVPVVVRGGAAPPVASAPSITRVRFIPPRAPAPVDPGVGGTLSGSSGSWSPPPQPTVAVDLAAPAADAIAMIVYVVRGTTERATSWAPVTAAARQISFTRPAGGRCAAPMMFQEPPALGAQVRFAWVDADGRVSAHSTTIEVTADP